MSAGGYFSGTTLYAGHNTASDSSGAATFWTASTDQPDERMSMYTHALSVGDESAVRPGIAPSASVLQHAMVPAVHERGHGVVGIPFAMHEFEPPAPMFGVDQGLSGDPQCFEGHAADLIQTWAETGISAQAHPALLPCWEPPLAGNEASPVPPEEEDEEAYTFLCEWTDEHGTCNMTVYGDRVWMSQHLSRRHKVVGHERTQRACLWRGCTDTMNKGSLARHVVSRHLRAGASCGFCSKVYSRADVARRHARKCKVANGTSPGVSDRI